MTDFTVPLYSYTRYADGSIHGNDPGALLDARVLAKMPIVISHPRPDTETTSEYIYRNAYPAMQYDVPCNVQGGEWPFTYSLSGAPTGMTVGALLGDVDYGIIKWPTPTLGTHSGITITVTDRNGDTQNSLFSVECATAKYSFFDSIGGNDTTGDGSIGNPYASFYPWDSTDKNTIALANQIAVHRTGTYATSNLSAMSEVTDGQRYAMGTNKPRAFMGYPGEVAMFDFTESRMSFYVGGASNDVAFHNLSFTGFNATIKRLVEHWDSRLSAYKITYDHGAAPAGVPGSNAAIFFLGGNSSPQMYAAISHGNFDNLLGLGITTTYDVQNGVFSDNIINNSNSGLYVKLGDNLNISLRNNSGTGNSGVLMRVDNYNDVTNVELCYNNFEGSGSILAWGPEATTQVGRWEYRNTLKVTGGSPAIIVENSGSTAFLSERSVIEHTSAAPNGIDEDSVGAYTGVYTRKNLDLSDTSVAYTDINGELVAPYRADYLGIRGHEVVI